jgi:hypothetical protein
MPNKEARSLGRRIEHAGAKSNIAALNSGNNVIASSKSKIEFSKVLDIGISHG